MISMKKTLTFYSIFFIFLLLLQRGSGILTKIVLTNTITPDEYGIITLVAVSLPSLFLLITNFNFYQVLSHSSHGKRYFGFAFICTVAFSVIISILLYLFRTDFFEYLNLPVEYSDLFVIVIIITLFATGILTDFQGLFAGLKEYSLPGILVALPSIIRLLCVIALVLLNIRSFELVILIFGLSCVVPIILLFLSKEYRNNFYLIPIIEIPSKKIIAFGTAVFIVTSFSAFGQYLVRIVISHSLGISWQGYFDVSLTLVAFLLFSLGTMSFISIPETTDGNSSIEKRGGLGDVTRALFSFMILFSIILFFYSEFLIDLLFSKDFILGSKYVYILAIGYILLFLQNFLSNLNLSYAKNAKDYVLPMIIPLLSLPFFFFVTDFLIGFCKECGYGNGFIGAYISYTLIIFLVTILTIFFSRDLTPLRLIGEKAGRLTVTSCVTFGFLFLVSPAPLLGILLSVLIFGILIFYSGYLNKEMFLEIITLKKKT